MRIFRINLKPVVAATLLALFASPVAAQEGLADRVLETLRSFLPTGQAGATTDDPLDPLFERLKSADEVEAARIDREIQLEWSKSGSPAMDLLLKRGRDAFEKDDYAAAINHFSALIDHAPDFAEGWYGRALALAHSGRIGMAAADLEHVLALNPRHYSAIYGLGTIFEQIDRHERAYDAYKLVLGYFPQHEEAKRGLKRVQARGQGAEL